jgi:hypothetical protein
MDFGGASTRAVAILPRVAGNKKRHHQADEDNAVASRIATAPLDLAVGHCDLRTSLNVLCPTELFIVACVSDDGDVLISLHLITVGPITVCLPAAGQVRIVRLPQLLEPLAM